MKALLQPTIILLLFVLVYCVDVLTEPSKGARKIIYGVLALLAFAYLIIALFVQ